MEHHRPPLTFCCQPTRNTKYVNLKKKFIHPLQVLKVKGGKLSPQIAALAKRKDIFLSLMPLRLLKKEK